MAETPTKARVTPAAFVLSDDVVVNLYRHLPSRQDRAAFSLACKRWHKAVCRARRTCRIWSPQVLPAVIRLSPQLTSIDCSGAFHMEDEHVMALAERYSTTLTQLDLANNKRVTEQALKFLGKKCQLLRVLNLRNGTYGDTAIMGAAGCSSLEVLRLTNCRAVTDVGVSCIAARCKGLRELSLHWCMGITDEAIEILVLNCTHLTAVDLGYTQVTAAAMESLAAAPSLQSLVLSGCKNICDDGMRALATGCKSLQVLDVSGCALVSNSGIQALAEAGVPLTDLLVAVCPQVSDPVLPHLAKFSGLTVVKLDLNAISNSGLAAFSAACGREEGGDGKPWQGPLEELSIPRCTDISNAGLLAVLPGWQGLKRLNLTCCKKVTDAVLLCLSRHCRDLRALHLEGCSSITLSGLKALADGCPRLEDLDVTDCDLDEEAVLAVAQCAELQRLKLGFCEGVTDAVLHALATTCSQLRALDLYRCTGFGPEGLAHVGKGCVDLADLNISYCLEGWTDASMLGFCPHAASLRNLEMRGCRRVTGKGLAALASGCVGLEELDLKKCTGITDVGLLAIALGCTYLRQISLSYCPVSDEALRALGSMGCMVKFNLIHCKKLTPAGLAQALLACAGLRKVKLVPEWKPRLPAEAVQELESRGAVFRWMTKPPDREAEENGGIVTE